MSHCKTILLSYCIENYSFAKKLISFFEERSYHIVEECLKNAEDDKEVNVIKNIFLSVLLFSKDYAKFSKTYSYYIHSCYGDNGSKDLKGILDSKKLLLINIDEESKSKVENIRQISWPTVSGEKNESLFWRKIENYLRLLKKRSSIKSALSKQFTKNPLLTNDSRNHGKASVKPKQDDLDQNYNRSSDNNIKEEFFETEYNPFSSTSYTYENFERVLPHLLTDTFDAEDEDLTKSDVEDLTLKLEDIEALMVLNTPKKPDEKPIESKANQKESKIFQRKNKKYESFATVHEQMQLLQDLQEVHKVLLNKVEKVNNPLKKKSYRRLLKRFDHIIFLTLNGHKDVSAINELPLLKEKLDQRNNLMKCCCCDILLHSERALEIHLPYCVKKEWKILLKN